MNRAKVQKITIPVLLLWGGKTILIHQLVNDELERLLQGNKNAKRVTLPAATHGIWAEQPQECARVVLEFLEGK